MTDQFTDKMVISVEIGQKPEKTVRLRARSVLAAAAAAAAVTTIATAGIAAAQPASAATTPNAVAPKIAYTRCPGGILAITTKPAKGFNPLTATTAQLEANNYPSPPPKTQTAAYGQWKKFVVSPRALTSTCPNTKPNNHRDAGTTFKTPVLPDGVTSDAATTNWSGYMAHGTTYTQVEAQWHVPGVIGAASGTNEYSSAWVGVGLGQSSGTELMQAGTESDYVGGKQQNYLWYELFPLTDQFPQINVSPGDVVGAHVAYSPSGPTFHIWDTNKHYNQTLKFGFAGADDGHAEWIYERTTINNELPYLADAPATFSSAQAGTGSGWTTLSAANDVDVLMYTCPGTTEMAYPEPIQGSSSFTAHFLSHGDNNACK
jgi:Peptidase A4 family